MINYSSKTLSNGLKVLVHEDPSTPLVTVNILYRVGARDENPDKTGFAHLFEHLMFGGSVNIPEYDSPLQLAGGDNNAFTNNDITNYYLTLPANNIETGANDRCTVPGRLVAGQVSANYQIIRGPFASVIERCRCPLRTVGHDLIPVPQNAAPSVGITQVRMGHIQS